MLAKITYWFPHAIYKKNSTQIHQDVFESEQLSRASLNQITTTENVVVLATRLESTLMEAVHAKKWLRGSDCSMIRCLLIGPVSWYSNTRQAWFLNDDNCIFTTHFRSHLRSIRICYLFRFDLSLAMKTVIRIWKSGQANNRQHAVTD